MADRPGGPVPTWATDAEYNAPSEAWDGAPTKIAPAQDLQAQGWAPGERPPAERMNWWMGSAGGFAAYHDAIEVQNWSAPFVTVNEATNAVAAYHAVADVAGACYLGLGPDLVRSFHGRTWSVETISGIDPIRAIATNYGQDGITTPRVGVVGDNAKIGYKVLGAGAFTVDTLDADNEWERAHAIVADGTDGWLVGGGVRLPADGTAWRGRIYRLDQDFALNTAIELGALPAGYSGMVSYQGLSHLIKNPAGRWLACLGFYEASTGGVAFYWSADGASFTLVRATGITDDVVNLAWDPYTEQFIAITEAGAMFGSADGTTWLQISAGTSIDTGKRNVLAIRGGLWVALVTINGAATIGWSVDQGATWNDYPNPFEGASVGPVSMVARVGDRYYAGSDASGSAADHYGVLSLRCK